jgi:hypothetical protein
MPGVLRTENTCQYPESMPGTNLAEGAGVTPGASGRDEAPEAGCDLVPKRHVKRAMRTGQPAFSTARVLP